MRLQHTLILLLSFVLGGCTQQNKVLDSAFDSFSAATAIKIENFTGDAMEPCISPDGQTLFFNNSNAINSKIYFARRLSENTFQCQGILPGTSSQAKDMAPSMDLQNNFYFTSLRSFDRDHRSIYAGKFNNGEVKEVHSIGGNIASSNIPGAVNMDCCISPDGQFLIVSRAQFLPGVSIPYRSQLLVSKKLADNSFQQIANSENVTKTAGDFAYAPAISSENKEIFYTTANMSDATTETKEITVAPDFKTVSKPRRVAAMTGFAEAISFTQNESEAFFHKKVGSIYCIFHANRRSKQL